MEKRHNPKRPKNQIPWLILFPNDNKSNSCTLFNPEEKDKLYKTQDLGEEFAKSDCIATYESWLLMQDSKYNLYILNPFTRERINPPPVESQLGMTKIERTIDDRFLTSTDHNGSEYNVRGMDKRSPVFWIDEKTKDYVVIWDLEYIWCLVYAKKGDTSWNQIPEIAGCLHMVYKDQMLYFSSYKNIFAVLDFSGEIPQQTFQCSMLRFNFKLFGSRLLRNSWCVAETKIVVRVTGDVLLVERMFRPMSRIQSFRVYKVYSSGFFKDYEKVDSLGDEAMLLDLGITVPANEVEGLNRNYIYFSGSTHRKKTNEIFIFDI